MAPTGFLRQPTLVVTGGVGHEEHIMLDLTASDRLDLRDGDTITAPDGVSRGDIVWLDRVADHEVALRIATEAVLRGPEVSLYRAERSEGGSLVLRRVGGEPPADQAETAHPLSAYAPYFRDARVSAAALQAYRVGQVLYEPTFCDATYKFGGFVAPHRYLLVSASARCLDAFSAHPEWGLCVWPRGRNLKVIDIIEAGGHVQIALLDVTEGYVAQCDRRELEQIERFFVDGARKLFEAALAAAPAPELDTDLWRERLVWPIGIDDAGTPFAPPG